MLIQILQIVGALLVLIAFILLQFKHLRATSLVYLSLNLVGGTLMAITAIINREWGFIVLESVWALVAAYGIAAAIKAQGERNTH